MHDLARSEKRPQSQSPPDITRDFGRPQKENSDTSPHTDGTSSLASFRKFVYEELMSRMADNDIIGKQPLSPELVEYCLPKRVDYTAWDTLLHQPLSLPDNLLSSMFSLKEDNGFSNYVRSPDTPTIFYLRSFSMTVSQLRSIVDDWKNRKYYYGEEATTWLGMTAAMSSEEVVYIRYIGATEKKTPFQRYTADFSSKTGPVLAKFLETVGRLCPTVLDSVAIYEFDEASHLSAKTCSLPEWKENRAMQTLPEQALIALFGFSSLLNQAVGGFLHTYNPDDDQRAVFKSLQTGSIEAMQQNLQTAPVDLVNKLRAWARSVFEHDIGRQRSLLAVEERLSKPGVPSKIYQFSESLQLTVMSQAVPALYLGQFTPVVTIGAEMSKDAYGKAEPFYTGQSRSADLMKKVLSKLYEWEEGLKETSSFTINSLIKRQGLPFVNLLPWLNCTKDDMSAAIGILEQYLGITRPYIILTLGKRPSSVAASNFRHLLGYKGRDPFYHKVGVLEVVDYGDWSSVQIPCFHPGQVQYVKDSKLFYKAMNLTLSILLLTIKVTIETHSAMRMSPQAARCIYIKNTVDSILQAKGIDVLLEDIKDGMQAVKDKGNKFHTKEETAAAKGSVINILGSKSLPNPIIFSALAVDAPFSYNRRAQVHRLWKLDIPALHLVISRDHRYLWHAWGNQLEEGTSFFEDRSLEASWRATIKGDPLEVRRKFKKERPKRQGVLGKRKMSVYELDAFEVDNK
ncbi:uncharacterized protein BP5553_01528 [Venustampulla echinocandica]|uniref:Uncharacterized protein n=1 Tax=Venustampulla echinocandica TaxID=2656787 RepID=A0A370U194_9HELO|nr:uncharacterized protein BP5553_01528 [Venustampulla echinocandica]RDL41549.1 hypothetical protein BP5553_01528 [Venustampulla echinocandica]